MSRKYSIDGEDTNTQATSILGLTSAATIRPMIYYLVIGSDAVPADMACDYILQRYTAAGTATSVTPQAIDPADPASLASAGKAHSAEPTYTTNAIMLRMPANQRATPQWYAAPGGEIKLPATAANGVGLKCDTTNGTAVNVGACIHFEE